MLRRRRREGGDQPGQDTDGHDAGLTDEIASGPWDAGDDYPDAERVDCGSLLIPVREGLDVQINVAEEQGAWVAVVQGDSGMQLQAFAAPRSGGLWDEVRHEIAANIAESGGGCEEGDGPLGTELRARVPAGPEEEPAAELLPVTFVGFDGPRWFLRGVISGPAATDPALRSPFTEVFSDVVVVRGDYPAPQRQQLEIRLPEEVQQALEEQLAQEEDTGWGLQNPFERGPEITEIR